MASIYTVLLVNDGDACTFHPYGVSIALNWDIAGDDEVETEAGSFFNGQIWRETWDLYDYSGEARVFNVDGHDTKEIYTALEEFERIVESGRHNVVLHKTFGDPAEVTATKEGFSVEYYDHD